VTEASRAAEAARSDVVSASSDLSSTLVDTVSRASGRIQSSNSSSTQSVSTSEELGQSADRIRTISDGIARATGLSAQQVQQIGFQLSGGVGTPGISPIKGSAMGSAGKSYSSSLSEAEQKVANELTTDQLREFRSFRDSATRDQSFVRSLGADSRDGQELASRLSSATSRVESAQSTYAERQAVAERLSTAYERGETLSIDLAQLPANSDFMRRYQRLASEYGSDSLALQAAMTSELATRALPPTRDSSSASALPASFSDINASRQVDLADPLFSRSRVGAADKSNDRSAAPGIGTRTLAAPDVPEAVRGLRNDVSSRTAAAGTAPSAAATFDARNEITRNPDGTVSTRRSQVLGNARQLRDDVSNLADSAGELVAGAPDRAAAAAAQARARNAESQRARDIEATPEVPTMLPMDGKRKKK
jgi:conjugal transfer mating pair stabilization protein TraG